MASCILLKLKHSVLMAYIMLLGISAELTVSHELVYFEWASVCLL
jgi:hypothetical protein